MKKYLTILQKSPMFSGIEKNDIEAMLACLNAKTTEYQKNEYILRVEDTVAHLGILLSGKAHIIQEDFWGYRNIIAKLMPSQLFAEAFACSPGSRLNISVIAESPAVVLLLDISRVLSTCSSSCTFHHRIIRNLLSSIASKNLELSEKLTHITKRTTREKLLSYLLAESMRQGSPSFDIPYNRQQLADYLSVDRSAMSNELCKMRDEGVLTFEKNHFDLLAEPY